MTSTDLTLISFNCSANSHHVVTVGLEEASVKSGTQTVSNMKLFVTVRTVENVQRILVQ